MREVTCSVLLLGTLVLSGCLSTTINSLTAPAAVPPEREPSIAASSVDRLVGAWGVASYRDEKDRARTEVQARSQCRLPYVIKRGPSDGVLMHVADDATPHELALKRGTDGKVYLGFAGPPGDSQDRVIVSITDNEFVTRYVDPDTNARYGTFVYVRCGKA